VGPDDPEYRPPREVHAQWMAGEQPQGLPADRRRAPQTMIAYVHVRRDLVERGADLQTLLDDVNQHIVRRRGIILSNRQILTTPLQVTWDVETYFDDGQSCPVEHQRCAWDERHQSYFSGLFGVDKPFQYAEDAAPYQDFCLSARVPVPFLRPGERALALVDATRDHRHYYCPCHYAEVVYTSARRLVCMSCGQMHCVLAAPLPHDFGTGLSNDEWEAAFGADALPADEETDLPLVEYQETHAAEKLWETDAWLEASGEIEFLTRGDPAEVARYRASLLTAQDLIDAGWEEAPEPPPPAAQIDGDWYGVDIVENAAAALNAGAIAYAKGRTDPSALREALLSVFQAVELLLKIKLEDLDPGSSAVRLDNPSVLKALAARGVALDGDTTMMITSLRRLRNKLQHSGARYGFRSTRALLARTFVFLDVFVREHLGWWIGDVVEQPGWDALLALAPIHAQVQVEVQKRMDQAKEAGADLVECPHCSQQSVVRQRPHQNFCLYCRRTRIPNALEMP
jgi:hypothetical protein